MTKQQEWQAFRDRLLEIDGNKCIKCGSSAGVFLHHIVRKYNGGTDSPDNLITVCRHCHFSFEDMSKWSNRLGRKRRLVLMVKNGMLPKEALE